MRLCRHRPPACSYGNREIPPGRTHTHTLAHPLLTPTRGGGGPAGPGHRALGTAPPPRRAVPMATGCRSTCAAAAEAAQSRSPPGHRPLACRLAPAPRHSPAWLPPGPAARLCQPSRERAAVGRALGGGGGGGVRPGPQPPSRGPASLGLCPRGGHRRPRAAVSRHPRG